MEVLTLETLTEYLGRPEKKIGTEYLWQCPICQDSGKDNLKFNERKNILYCFANDRHAGAILSDICKNNKGKYTQPCKKPIKPIVEPVCVSKEQGMEHLKYMFECNNTLLADTKVLNFLYKKRGLTPETVDFTGIGIDKKKRLWAIPTFDYSTDNIIGFEFRPADLSKKGLHRTKGTPNGMAMVNAYTPKTDILCIVEGYFDGYALWQYLTEQGQSEYYHIVTPSNGVNSLLKYVAQIDFNKYKKHYLYIDNDEVSRAKAGEIMEKYPMLGPVTMNCNCKDFNEHYLKCLQGYKT